MSDDKYAVLPRSVGDDDDSSDEESEDEEIINDEEKKNDENTDKSTTDSKNVTIKKAKLPPRNTKKSSTPKNNSGLSGRNIEIDYNNSTLIPISQEKVPVPICQKEVNIPFYRKRWFKITATVVITIFCSLFIVWLTIKMYKRYYMLYNDPVNSVMHKSKSQIDKEREEELKRMENNTKHADAIFNETKKDSKKKTISGGHKRKPLKRDAKGKFVKR